MQTSRIYVVINKKNDNRRLVQASSAAQAIRHCVRGEYAAKVPSTTEVADLLMAHSKAGSPMLVENAIEAVVAETEQTNIGEKL